MTDHDHERIWLEPSCAGDERYWSNYPVDDCPEEGCGTKSTEYVRADLVEALQTENQRLRAVLEKIAATGRCEFAAVRAALSNTEASHE